jgi:hypothetical protein
MYGLHHLESEGSVKDLSCHRVFKEISPPCNLATYKEQENNGKFIAQ